MSNQVRFECCRVDERWLAAKQVSQEAIHQAVAAALAQARAPAAPHPRGERAVFPRAARKMRRCSGLAALGEEPVFLKLFIFSRLRDRLLLHCGISKAAKAYANALRLQELGIPCATPRALVKSRKPLTLTLVSEALQEGATLGRRVAELFDGRPAADLSRDWRALTGQLAAFVARLHEQGIYHSDLHPKNLWVQDRAGGEATFYLLDVEEITFCGRISRPRRLANLLHLARNFAKAAARAQLDGIPFAQQWATAYQEAAGLPASAQLLAKVQAAACRGMQLAREELARR